MNARTELEKTIQVIDEWIWDKAGMSCDRQFAARLVAQLLTARATAAAGLAALDAAQLAVRE